MTLMPTSCSHIFAVFFIIFGLKMLVNVILDISWQKGLPFKVGNFIALFNFEWHSQNEVSNFVILVLWRDCEKLYRLNVHTEIQLDKLYKFYEMIQIQKCRKVSFKGTTLAGSYISFFQLANSQNGYFFLFVLNAKRYQIKEGRIFLSGSSQGESSVMRVRLEGCKKPIMNTH